jgi:hypothetical protein
MADPEWLKPFDTSSAVVVLRTADNRVVWVNQTFTAVTRIEKDDLLGKPPPEAPGLPDQARMVRMLKDVIRRQRIAEEITCLTLDEVTRWFECRHTPLAPEFTNGHGWCVLTNAVEITAQVQLAALGALLGLRARKGARRNGRENDETFVKLLLRGTSIHDLCTALGMSVEEVTGRLTRLAGTPLR